jgi:predicted nucleic acid-binding protein
VVVLNASTAILLAKLELLDPFLRDVGQTVFMPEIVREECCGRDSLDARLITRAIDENRITAKAVGRSAIQRLVDEFGLGRGEAAAIAMASSKKAMVATDDKRGINACKVLRVPFTTAISVLVRLFENGVVSRQEALEKLEMLARYGRYKTEIIAAARADLEK